MPASLSQTCMKKKTSIDFTISTLSIQEGLEPDFHSCIFQGIPQASPGWPNHSIIKGTWVCPFLVISSIKICCVAPCGNVRGKNKTNKKMLMKGQGMAQMQISRENDINLNYHQILHYDQLVLELSFNQVTFSCTGAEPGIFLRGGMFQPRSRK